MTNSNEYCLVERLKDTNFNAICFCRKCVDGRNEEGPPEYSKSLYPQDAQEDNTVQSDLGRSDLGKWPGNSNVPPEYQESQPLLAEYEAVKHDLGKNRHDLIDPHFLTILAAALTFGAEKYSDDNWLTHGGLKWSRIYGALQRHLVAFSRGAEMDPESNLTHLGHAAAMLMMLARYEYDYRYKGNDDRLFVEDEYFEGMDDNDQWEFEPHLTKAQVERWFKDRQ